LSVAARALTRTARGDPAARGRAKNARGVMTDGVPALEERFLELDAERARAHVELRPGADGPSAHPLRVDDDATRSTADTAANAATSAEGNERDPFAPRETNESGNFVDRFRPNDGIGQRPARVACGELDEPAWPQVPRVRFEIGTEHADARHL